MIIIIELLELQEYLCKDRGLGGGKVLEDYGGRFPGMGPTSLSHVLWVTCSNGIINKETFNSIYKLTTYSPDWTIT